MELADVIKLMRQMADRLEQWAERNRALTRHISPCLIGTRQMDFERALGWLERNKPQMLGPIQTHYNELVSCAEGIDQFVANTGASDLETATSRLGTLRYYAFRLANTLRDTAEDLMSDDQIVTLISNIKTEEIDTLLELFHKLQELPESRPKPQNEKLWAKAERKVRKKLYEAGEKTTLNGKGEEDFGELRELHRLLTNEYSNITKQLEEKSLEEMAELMVKEGKAKTPFEAMIEIEYQAKSAALIEERLWRRIEKEYRKNDSDYDQELGKKGKEVADVIEQIKQSLNFNEPLVKLDRMLDEKLMTSLEQIQSYNFFDVLLQSGEQDLVKSAIDALETIKGKVEQQQKTEPAGKPTGTGQGKKKIKKRKKTEKRFEHWESPGDACFVIENNRIKFHYQGKIENLRLKNESRTHKLLFLLSSGTLLSDEIKAKICSEKTKPFEAVSYANETLNKKIAALGFVDVPRDVEFIKYDKQYNTYSSILKIYAREEFDRQELQQPLVDDRRYKDLGVAEDSF